MGVFEHFPYVNFHEMNLDWILTKIKELFSKNEELENEIDANTDDINDIDSRVDYIYSILPSVLPTQNIRRYICIGDSICEGYNPDGNVDGWATVMKTAMNASNNDFYINYKGGAGFYGNTSGKNFQDLLQDLESTVEEPNTITDIIVAGGYNDINKNPQPSEATYRNLVNTFCDYALAHYPNAIVHFYWLAKDKALAFYASQSTLLYYLSTIKKKNFRLHTETSAAMSGISNFSSDGIHVNQTAENNIASTIMTGHFQDRRQIFPVADSNFTASTFPSITTQIQDEITTIYIGAANIVINTTDTPSFICDGAHVYKIASMPSGYWIGNDMGNYGRSSTHSVYMADVLFRYTPSAPSKYYQGKAALFAYQGDIYVCPYCNVPETSGFLQSASGIYWSNQSASFYSVV